MPPAIPRATYRVQLTAEFGFDQTTAIVPYLKALGITHLYASPFMKARKGSTHGYDIVDHTQFNPELGGEAAFERLSAALKRHDLGLILDFVPNHMGVHFADNPWWLDVLEWGPASPHAVSFDIDWDTLPYRSRGGVLLPILGKSYGEALANGDIELRYDEAKGSFSAWYFEHRLPITPERYGEILRTIVRHTNAHDEPMGQALLALAERYDGLRRPNFDEAPDFKAALAAIAGGAAVIARGLEAYRAGPDRPTQTHTLHLLLERQNFRLGHWRLASSEINYRRFFDVNTLAGLRVEDAATFDAIHRLVKRLVAEDKLQGLRLDHVDGLHDPAQYIQRLRRLIRDAQGGQKPFYVLIEKILGEGEKLAPLAGVQGTTGYEWLNVISRVMLHGPGMAEIEEVWRQASNQSPKFAPVLREAKRRVLETLLLSEFTVLNRLLTRIANGQYTTRDFSGDILRQAFELYVLHFPVYRTYLTATGSSELDCGLISETIEKARADWFGADEGLFDFLRDTLTMDLAANGRGALSKPRLRRFALKVQQFTGPTMAKSLEDTAFYRYHRLLALNEVGGDPSSAAMPIADFHALMERRVKETPHGLTATATHDTKRGEDARARILALAELPGEWTSLVGRWKLLNASHITANADVRSPSTAFEYMIYQALIGVWPIAGDDPDLVERMQAYVLKAAREGKLETSWLNPNVEYEEGLKVFIASILDRTRSPEFLSSIAEFVQRVALLGAVNSLGQTALKATMPGVPDFYQGTEGWDLSLVDPDNRRPVDFATHAIALAQLDDPNWQLLSRSWRDGRIKLALTRQLLKFRAEYERLFTDGDYAPLTVQGEHSDHVIAFVRRFRKDAILIAVGKSFASTTDGGRSWPDPAGWRGKIDTSGYVIDGVGDNYLDLKEAFRELPFMLLHARLAQ